MDENKKYSAKYKQLNIPIQFLMDFNSELNSKELSCIIDRLISFNDANASVNNGVIDFSKRYKKLDKDEFTTVRWNDSPIKIGKTYDIPIIQKTARVIRIDLKKIKDLSDDFILVDADCSRQEFLIQMCGWYAKKKDWKIDESEVLVIHLKIV